MKRRRFQVLLEWDARDKVWVTCVPALNSLSTFGETRAKALRNTREAIKGYLEAVEKEGLPPPTGDGKAESMVDFPTGLA